MYQSLNASGNYVLSGEVSDDFGQHFGPAGTLGTDDLMYKWRGDYGYRWDRDGLWTGSYTEPVVEVGARYYLPIMGVFITRDKDLSQEPYEYCYADVEGQLHSGMTMEEIRHKLRHRLLNQTIQTTKPNHANW